jgi:hypothetical protein
MKERPILFSGPMVRALLAGQKTQTRRILKLKWGFDFAERDDGTLWPWAEHPDCDDDVWMPCPQGEVGDRLWVRETWAYGIHAMAAKRDEEGPFVYAADGTTQGRLSERWTPSIHMPRWANRILLDITALRAERLQDISDEDARAEGIECMAGDPECGYRNYLDKTGQDWALSPRESFRSLWESINGPASWAKKPWVWVVEFERAQAQQKGPAS